MHAITDDGRDDGVRRQLLCSEFHGERPRLREHLGELCLEHAAFVELRVARLGIHDPRDWQDLLADRARDSASDRDTQAGEGQPRARHLEPQRDWLSNDLTDSAVRAAGGVRSQGSRLHRAVESWRDRSCSCPPEITAELLAEMLLERKGARPSLVAVVHRVAFGSASRSLGSGCSRTVLPDRRRARWFLSDIAVTSNADSEFAPATAPKRE
ncbi:hypothetical protein [Curtobacterium flaccumfaciens]|uniref:hypothetical protein n=1 Tax=Curtobacterium flaccumfaciens TaxID=2035 RepID=UPI001BDF688B|nr:hypothetical protein [Curtobacterium flaccumfaciens]MCX2845993.1 hypothetical protein [Curtobacterium flaccumfaciens pv. oortii]